MVYLAVLDVVEEEEPTRSGLPCESRLMRDDLGQRPSASQRIGGGDSVGEMAMTRTVFESARSGINSLLSPTHIWGAYPTSASRQALEQYLMVLFAALRVEHLAAVGAYRCATFIANFAAPERG